MSELRAAADRIEALEAENERLRSDVKAWKEVADRTTLLVGEISLDRHQLRAKVRHLIESVRKHETQSNDAAYERAYVDADLWASIEVDDGDPMDGIDLPELERQLNEEFPAEGERFAAKMRQATEGTK